MAWLNKNEVLKQEAEDLTSNAPKYGLDVSEPNDLHGVLQPYQTTKVLAFKFYFYSLPFLIFVLTNLLGTQER